MIPLFNCVCLYGPFFSASNNTVFLFLAILFLVPTMSMFRGGNLTGGVGRTSTSGAMLTTARSSPLGQPEESVSVSVFLAVPLSLSVHMYVVFTGLNRWKTHDATTRLR